MTQFGFYPSLLIDNSWTLKLSRQLGYVYANYEVPDPLPWLLGWLATTVHHQDEDKIVAQSIGELLYHIPTTVPDVDQMVKSLIHFFPIDCPVQHN